MLVTPYYPDFCGHPEDGGSHQLLGDPAGAAPDLGTSYVSGKHVERPGSRGGNLNDMPQDVCNVQDDNNHQLLGDPAGEAADHVADYVSGQPVERPG